jgi:hypothetical protein
MKIWLIYKIKVLKREEEKCETRNAKKIKAHAALLPGGIYLD